MADNKQYVIQQQEQGAVLISEDVIATIIANAVTDVEGVVGLSTKPGADIADAIGKKNWGKGIKITIAQDNTVFIDCNVNVGYGQSVVNVANSVQNAITAALESTAGLKVAAINVNVCGIIRQ